MLLTIKTKLHGETHEVRADADAVLACDWAVANKGIMRIGDDATRDAASIERDAHIGDARRLANAAALDLMQRSADDWKARALNTKIAHGMLRKVR